jgi:hypothetical protein
MLCSSRSFRVAHGLAVGLVSRAVGEITGSADARLARPVRQAPAILGARFPTSAISARTSSSRATTNREIGNCRVIGNGYSIRSVAPWYGQLWIHDCEIIGLGSATNEAISLTMSQAGSTKVERSSFAESGVIHVTNLNDSTTTFVDNLVLENSVVPIDITNGQGEPLDELPR